MLNKQLLLLVTCTVLTVAQDTSTPLYTCSKKTTSTKSAASKAFKHYMELVKPGWLERSARRNEEEVMKFNRFKFMGVVRGAKMQCLTEFHYSPQTNRLHRGRRLMFMGDCGGIYLRDEIIQTVFNYILANARMKLTHAFRFWVDLTDASVMHPDVFDVLSYPVLAFGTYPGNPNTMPIPEILMLLSIAGVNPELLKFVKAAGPPLTWQDDTAEAMAKLFNWQTPEVTAYEAKKPKALYRGGCYPTFHPHAVELNSNAIMHVRGNVCKASKDTSDGLLDVGLVLKPEATNNCGGTTPFYQQLCALCKPCETAEMLTLQEAVDYKYQIVVDGYGPTFDSVYWKLGSNSAVFYVQNRTGPGQTDWHPFYAQWFTPLIKPWVHYIPVTPDSLHTSVDWCKQNDDVCKELAKNAMKLIRCRVQVSTAWAYLAATLQMIHDTQPATSDVVPETVTLLGQQDSFEGKNVTWFTPSNPAADGAQEAPAPPAVPADQASAPPPPAETTGDATAWPTPQDADKNHARKVITNAEQLLGAAQDSDAPEVPAFALEMAADIVKRQHELDGKPVPEGVSLLDPQDSGLDVAEVTARSAPGDKTPQDSQE